MDEMEFISRHKRCNKKARKVSQPKKASKSPKSDEPEKVSGSPGPIDDQSEERQKPKKASRSSDGKRTTSKAGKKVKKTSKPKKAPKSPEFIDSSKEQELPRDDKEKKIHPFLGLKEEVQGSFELRKESKNSTFKKKVEKVVFMRGPYEGHELSYVALYDTKYLKRVLKMSGLEKKKTKDLIKQALAKA